MSVRLMESRLIRVYLLALISLALIAAINAGLAWWIVAKSVELAREERQVPGVLDTVAQAATAAAGVGGAIATITTALIARYGAREATRNLGASGGTHEPPQGH